MATRRAKGPQSLNVSADIDSNDHKVHLQARFTGTD